MNFFKTGIAMFTFYLVVMNKTHQKGTYINEAKGY